MSLGEVVGCIVRITPNIGELCNLLAFLKAWLSSLILLLQLNTGGIQDINTNFGYSQSKKDKTVIVFDSQ